MDWFVQISLHWSSCPILINETVYNPSSFTHTNAHQFRAHTPGIHGRGGGFQTKEFRAWGHPQKLFVWVFFFSLIPELSHQSSPDPAMAITLIYELSTQVSPYLLSPVTWHTTEIQSSSQVPCSARIWDGSLAALTGLREEVAALHFIVFHSHNHLLPCHSIQTA